MPRIAFTPGGPQPAHLPPWFSRMVRGADALPTVRRCVPVLDYLSSGYLFTFPAEVEFEAGECDRPDLVFGHDADQHPGLRPPRGYGERVYKLANPHAVATPPGYSCLFLPAPEWSPLYALPGIVDTDSFPGPVNLPFVAPPRFTGRIAAGTPLARLFPYRRESWDSEAGAGTRSTGLLALGDYRAKWWQPKAWR